MISPGQDAPGDPRLDERGDPPEETEHGVRLPAGTSLKLDRLQRSLEAARQREAALHAELTRLRQQTPTVDDPVEAASRAARLIVETAAEQARSIIAAAERQAMQPAEPIQAGEQRTGAAFPPRPPRGDRPQGPEEPGGADIAAGAVEARDLVEAATAAVGDLGRSLLQLEQRFASAAQEPPRPSTRTSREAEKDDAASAGGGGKVLLQAGPFPNRVALARFQRALSELPGVLDVEAGGLEGEWTTLTVRTNPGTQLAHVMRAELTYPFAVDPPAADGRYTITLGGAPG